MKSNTETIEIKAADQSENSIRVYGIDGDNSAPVMIIFPAMGARASYYEPLALALNEAGFHGVTADLRGVGESSVRITNGADFGYNDMVTIDYPAIISSVRERFPENPLFLLGHSLGGQLAAMYAAARPDGLQGLILIATCSVYYKKWPFPQRYGLLFFLNVVSLISLVMGYFPGHRLGFGGKAPRTQMLDWAHQGRTGRYEPNGAKVNFDRLMAKAAIPILSVSFSDDGYCPRAACGHLADKMAASMVTRRHYTPDSLNEESIGHFGWVKKAYVLKPVIKEWVAGLTTGRD